VTTTLAYWVYSYVMKKIKGYEYDICTLRIIEGIEYDICAINRIPSRKQLLSKFGHCFS
jgi:hypothetical protein